MRKVFIAGTVLFCLAFAAPPSHAQNAPLRVCVAFAAAQAFPNVQTAKLANALSQQKLHSDRSIQGVALAPVPNKQIPVQMQANSCDYFVELESPYGAFMPSDSDVPNAGDYAQMGVPLGGTQFPSDAVSGPNFDRVVQYKILLAGQKHPVAHGSLMLQRGQLPHPAYQLNYASSAAQIARKLKGAKFAAPKP